MCDPFATLDTNVSTSMCISYASEQLKNIHLPHRTTKTFRDMIYKKNNTEKMHGKIAQRTKPNGKQAKMSHRQLKQHLIQCEHECIYYIVYKYLHLQSI